MERENLSRLAIGKNLRAVVVDLDQVVGETVRAINIVDQMREFVVRDRALIIFEHVPFRFASENAKIVCRARVAAKDRQREN